MRVWQCLKYGKIHQKDINAAMNIKDKGLRLLAIGHIASACGERVRSTKGRAFVRHHLSKQESPVKPMQGG